jgi:phenylalanyl-tRNA synthetase beta chain
VVDSLLKNLSVRYTLAELTYPCFIPGRAATVLVDKKVIGRFGEIHPQVLEAWQLKMPAAVFELDLERLIS